MDKHVHHLEHLALYSLVIWQLVLGMRIILKYLVKNWPPMWAKKSEGLPFRDYEVAPHKKKFGAIDVDVNKKVTLGDTSKLTGNLKATTLTIEEGAKFEGACNMTTNNSAVNSKEK